MSDPTTTGSIEILINPGPEAESVGLEVKAVTVELVPTLVTAIYGFTDLAVATPETEAEDRALAIWTATDSRFRPVRIILWPETDIDFTAMAVALKVTDGGEA